MDKSKRTFKMDENAPTALDAHKLIINKQVNIVFDENTKLVRKSKILKFTDSLVWLLASIVLPFIHFFLYGLKIRGRANIRAAKARKKGIVTIANHCMIMDSTISSQVMLPNQIYLPTVEETLKIPKVRFIVKALHAIPIPSNAKGLKHFADTCEELLYKNKVVHFYPEGSLWPWHKELRPFKIGAFRFAANTDSCILPLAITFRKRKGLWKLIGKKPLITVTVLPHLLANKVYRPKKSIQDLMERSFNQMSKLIPPSPSINK